MTVYNKQMMIFSVGLLIVLFVVLYKNSTDDVDSCWTSFKFPREFFLKKSNSLSEIDRSNLTDRKAAFSCLDVIRTKTQACLYDKLKNAPAFWPAINPAISECAHFLQKTVGYIKLENTGDYKFIILPDNKDYAKQPPCTLLTIGIGEDIESEKKVKGYMPNCIFAGTDPIHKSGVIYEQLGTFWNVAVSDKNGSIIASVYEGGTYIDKTVESVDFRTILRKMNETLIDYLFLDAEGAEYKIFPLLTGDQLKPHAVCQISVEIHGFSSTYKMTENGFKAQVLNLLQNSGFVPLFGEYMFNNAFNRMFWVNFESEECVQKYFGSYCNFVTVQK